MVLAASMSFVASERAYMLFPITAFDMERFLAMRSYRDGLVIDQECLDLLDCQISQEATAWEATGARSEWRSCIRFVGDSFCWSQTLPAMQPTLILKAGLFFKERRREALHANSWEFVYDELGTAYNSFNSILYLGPNRNYCVTAEKMRDEWVKSCVRVMAKYGGRSTE